MTRAKRMIVAGVMSGTSADGVDVAICRISAGPDGAPRVKVVGHRAFPYPRAVRSAVLRAMEGHAMPAAEFSRLAWRLGAVYADCVSKACADLGVRTGPGGTQPASGRAAKLNLVGCHGQTVYHQAVAERYLGAKVRCTSQIGEAAVLAEHLRCPVVSDFRPADLAAGGQGAPLVPMLDWTVFRSPRVGRVLQNLGGIGNLTALPAGADLGRVLAFDTGPANMVIDTCMRRLFGRNFDRGGAVARRGRVLQDVLQEALRNPFFSTPPPKSCGREEFGEHFSTQWIRRCQKSVAKSKSHSQPHSKDADIVATATALTSASIVQAYRNFVLPHMAPTTRTVEYLVAGGGAKNTTLLDMLRTGLHPMGAHVRDMAELGFAPQAKEAVAFALLAWLTWHQLPGNVVSATGARHPAVLGKVSFG